MPYWTRGRRVRNLIGLVVSPVLVIVMLRWFEHCQVYHPLRALEANGADLGRPWEDVFFRASDQTRLHGWFFPADPHSRRGDWAILFCHGNGGNISHRLENYQALLELGVSVFAFDYRGYGQSAGRPSEEGTYQDAEAAWRWLREKGFQPGRVVALGESLGGGVATELARRVPLGGLILVSTFTSVPDVGAELFPFLPARWIWRIHYDTLRKLPGLKVPLLVMHSRSDTLIRCAHGEKLFAAANEPKLFWEIYGDHNDTLATDLGRYREGIDRFLTSLVPSAPSPD